jgi:hypothetical protein
VSARRAPNELFGLPWRHLRPEMGKRPCVSITFDVKTLFSWEIKTEIPDQVSSCGVHNGQFQGNC